MSDEQTTGKRKRKAKGTPETAQGGTITAPDDTLANPDASAVKTPISDSGRECPSPAKCAVCDGKGGECALCNGSGVMPEGATATKTVGEAMKEIEVTVNAKTGEIDPPNAPEMIQAAVESGTCETVAEFVATNTAGELVIGETVVHEWDVSRVEVRAKGVTPETPESIAWDQETARVVSNLEVEVSEAEAEYEELKDETKKAKEHLEAKERELRSLIRWRRENKGKPQQADLFSRPADPHDAEGLTESPDKDLAPDDYKPAVTPEASSDASALMDPKPTEEPEDETWKQVPLASLSLKPWLLAKLASPIHKDKGPISPITTMGELAAYQEPTATGYCHRLIDIKGIGEKAADEIGEACLQFWNERAGKGGAK